jgi:hypothetical protein
VFSNLSRRHQSRLASKATRERILPNNDARGCRDETRLFLLPLVVVVVRDLYRAGMFDVPVPVVVDVVSGAPQISSSSS